jgi:hypothetical protein
LAKEEAEKRRRVEEQKAKDAAIEEKRKELERQRAAEEAEEQRKIAERLELLALKEAKVAPNSNATMLLSDAVLQGDCARCNTAAGEGKH